MSDGRGGEKIEKEWRMSVPLQPRGAGGWEGRGAGAGAGVGGLSQRELLLLPLENLADVLEDGRREQVDTAVNHLADERAGLLHVVLHLAMGRGEGWGPAWPPPPTPCPSPTSCVSALATMQP